MNTFEPTINSYLEFCRRCGSEEFFFKADFTKVEAIEYVYESNRLEQVGVQNIEDTQNILEDLISASSDLDPKSVLETKQTYEALKFFSTLREEQGKTIDGIFSLLLTSQQICDAHSILMKNITGNAGKYREGIAYTFLDGEKRHVYPLPHTLESSMNSLCDMFYDALLFIDSHYQSLKDELEKTKYLFECIPQLAAWLLFHFVDIHPFSDGNGRMGRLLANHVLSYITFFPISICPHRKSGQSKYETLRAKYISCIEKCRLDSRKNFSPIAELIIESMYAGWIRCIDFHSQCQPTSMGCIIVYKKDTDQMVQQKLAERGVTDQEAVIAMEARTNIYGTTQEILISNKKSITMIFSTLDTKPIFPPQRGRL